MIESRVRGQSRADYRGILWSRTNHLNTIKITVTKRLTRLVYLMSSGTNERFEWESDPESESETATLLSTGIDVLDRKLGGGIPGGKIVTLSARPASQSELFLHEMCAVRETVYLTTERREADIKASFRDREIPLEEIEIHQLDLEAPFEAGLAAIEELPERSLLVVDPMNPLEEQDTVEYRAFLTEIKAHVEDRQGLALLHCLDGAENPSQRDRTEYHSDVIFSLNTTLRGGSVENTLSVPKFRGGRALPEAIDLELTADVTIDVSRKIA